MTITISVGLLILIVLGGIVAYVVIQKWRRGHLRRYAEKRAQEVVSDFRKKILDKPPDPHVARRYIRGQGDKEPKPKE